MSDMKTGLFLHNVAFIFLGIGSSALSAACSPDVNLGNELLGTTSSGVGGAGGGASTGSVTASSTGTASTSAGSGGAPPSAACAAVAGAIQPLESAHDSYAALEGDWQICDGATAWPGAPADTIGVEFGPASDAPAPGGSTVGGKMYYLVQGPTGPVPGEGVAYQLTYDLSPDGGDTFQLNMHAAPQSGFGGPFSYSASPRQFLLTWDFGSPSARLIVPF